jgi:hypothetical protein
MDVKAMRTQKADVAEAHLENSLRTFLWLVERARNLDRAKLQALRDARDYEAIDALILGQLMGK